MGWDYDIYNPMIFPSIIYDILGMGLFPWDIILSLLSIFIIIVIIVIILTIIGDALW